MTDQTENAEIEANTDLAGQNERLVINPVKCAAQIAIIHRRLMDAMTKQGGPCEIAAALDNLEGAVQKARDDLGLSATKDLLVAEAGVIVSQFIAFMQMRSVNLCHVFIGDDPQLLTVDEMLEAVAEFKATLKGN